MRTAEAVARSLALAPLLLIAACGGTQDTARAPEPAEGTPPVPKTSTATQAPLKVPPSGLSPLPTPQQVVTSVPVGRRDPFGPLPGSPQATAAARAKAAAAARRSSSSASAAAVALPADFRFTGVISSAGGSEAVVQYGPLSGSIRPGDRGGRTTDLLPAGWSVASINVNRGTVTLSHSGRNVRVDL